jgi:hypothetical protein
MSGQVEKVPPQFSINTICPIVINPSQNILTYQSASVVSTPSQVNASFSGCNPTPEDISFVLAENQITKCCNDQANVNNINAAVNANYANEY